LIKIKTVDMYESITQKHCNNAGNSTIKCSKTDVAKKGNRELVAVLEVLAPAMVLELQTLSTTVPKV